MHKGWVTDTFITRHKTIEDNPRAEFNAGTFPTLSLSASRKNDTCLISVTNMDPEKERPVSIDLRGGTVSGFTARILTAPALNSHNNFEQPNTVTPEGFTDFRLKNGELQFTIPAHSFLTFPANTLT